MRLNKFIIFLASATFSVAIHTEGYPDSVVRRANRLHSTLTAGIPLLGDNPNYIGVLNAVQAGDLQAAVRLIVNKTTGSREVYNVALPKLTRAFNREQSLGPIGAAANGGTDIDALLVGLARDREKISKFVTDDIIYYSPTLSNNGDDMASYFRASGRHYERVWQEQSPRDALVREQRPGFPAVGVLNSQHWGVNYVRMGTNRRNIYGILNNLYCSKHEQIRHQQIPDIFVGRDIDRSDPTYQTNCRTCHAQMDGWIRNAYARYDYQDGQGVQYGARKDKINETHSAYFDLLSPEAATFWLFFDNDQNSRVFGFRPVAGIPIQTYGSTGFHYMNGQTLADLGLIIAGSEGYYQCWIKRLITLVLLKKPLSLSEMSQTDWDILGGESAVIAREAAALQQSQDLVQALGNISIQYLDR